jgi:ATP-binding protein involved in chromosome partitioning
VKSYHDIVGDGGSRVLEQVAAQRTRIADGLAGVRHIVAVGSGKGGVGKSTLTLHLAAALRARGLQIAILDADFNGPSQARMAGVEGAFVPPPSPRPAEGRPSSRGYSETSRPSPRGLGVAGGEKVALPRARNGIAVFSMGSIVPESEALEFESAAQGESHTWRATREFSLLSEILGSFEWGALDLLMFDLPPGAERTVQYADYLRSFDVAQPSTALVPRQARDDPEQGRRVGMSLSDPEALEGSKGQGRPRVSFLLVTIPSEVARGVVARSVAALSKGPRPFDGAQGKPNRLLGYVENMSGYYCRDCKAIKPLFGSSVPVALGEVPCLGTVPFDPELARNCDRGVFLSERPETPVSRALDEIAQRLLERLP